MADITRTIQIIFGAVDQTGSALTSVGEGIKSLDSGISDITGPLDKLGNLVLKTETALLAMGAAMIGVSIDQAAKFSESMNAIGAEFGGTEQQIKDFSTQVLSFGQDSGKSLSDITAATLAAVDAGVKYTDSLELLKTTEQLSTLAHSDFAATTALVANTLNAYGASVDQATHFSDVFYQLTRTGKIEIGDLNNAFAKIATTAAQVGVPFDTLAASLAALTANGVPSTDAMRSLQAVISAIINPSKEAADLAASLGIAFNSTALQTQGFEGVLRNVELATGGNVDKMGVLFGSLGAVKTAMILTKDTGVTLAQSLGEISGSTGAVSEAFKLMENDLTRVNQNVVNNLQEVLIAAGTPLLEKYGSVAGALADVFKSLKFSIDAGAFDQLFAAINDFSTQATAYLEKVASALPEALKGLDFAGLIDSFDNLGAAVGRIFSGFDLTTPQGLHDAFQLVIDSVTSLTNVSTGIIDKWASVILKAQDLIGSFNTITGSSQQNYGALLGLSQIYETLSPVIQALGSAFGALGGALSTLSSIGSIVKNWEEITTVFKTLGLFFISPAGLAISATLLAVGAAIVYFSSKSEETAPHVDHLMAAFNEFKIPIVDAAKVMAELNTEMDKIVARTTNAGDVFQQQVSLTTSWDEALVKLNASLAANNQKIDEAGNVTSTLQTYTDKSAFATKNLGTTYDEAGNKVVSFGDALGGISTKFKASAESAVEATKKSDEYQLKMEELASNERIAVIKGAFELNIAQLEAQAKQAVAIIDSISTTIDSTGKLLSDLFGMLDEDLSFRAKFDIQNQIDLENSIRQQAASDQHDLAQSQVDMYKAQIDSLRSGTPLFNVNADGVEPELRQLLFKLLQLIQVEASGTYGNFLLALSP